MGWDVWKARVTLYFYNKRLDKLWAWTMHINVIESCRNAGRRREQQTEQTTTGHGAVTGRDDRECKVENTGLQQWISLRWIRSKLLGGPGGLCVVRSAEYCKKEVTYARHPTLEGKSKAAAELDLYCRQHSPIVYTFTYSDPLDSHWNEGKS